MGRKWTNVRFELSSRNENVNKASADPPTQEEELYCFLRERWGSDNVSPTEYIDVMFGGPSTDKLQRWVTEVFQSCEFVERAGVVFVTDSAHVGYGYVFERSEEGSAELVEEYQGYEGAEGNDVAEMIYEDYHIKVSSEWCWD